MSFLIQTRRHVWLAQSALTEACRRALRSIPVEPGVLFGSAALEALERTIQARQTRHQLSALSRTMPPPRRSRGPAAGHSARPQPRTLPQVANFPRPMQRRSGEEFRDAARQPGSRGCLTWSVVPPGPLRAVGPGDEAIRPAVG